MADNGKLVTVGTKVLLCTYSNSALTVEQYSDGGVLSAIPEVTDITVNHSDSINPGMYFMLYTPSNSYYIWYAKDNNEGNKPYISFAVGLKVDLVTGDDAATVATKTAAVIDTINGFATPVVNGSIITVTNVQGGPCPDAQDKNTGFKIAVKIQGEKKILFDGTLGTNIHKVLDVNINVDGSASILVETKTERKFQRGMTFDRSTDIRAEVLTTPAGWLF